MVGQNGKQHLFRAVVGERAVMVTGEDKNGGPEGQKGLCHHAEAIVSKGSRLREKTFYYGSPTIRSASKARRY